MSQSKTKKALVVQCAALGWNTFAPSKPVLGGMKFHPLLPVIPAVTCTAQASFRTAAPPSRHGMVSNGLFHRNLRRSMFWEQAAAQVQGPRIWERFRAEGGTVGLTFWQQSLGEHVDVILSPRPIHKHSGGMIQDCYSKPNGLYDELRARVGRDFNLMHYWGPLASKKSSEWITDAVCALMDMPEVCPDLLFTYLPHLDYDLQRHGPSGPKAREALQVLDTCLQRLADTARQTGRMVLVWGDYEMHDTSGPAVFPNRALREAGLLGARHLKGMAYADLFAARAFALTDHEIAHVFIQDKGDVEHTREILSELEGVEQALPREEVPFLNHPNSGELILFAKPGRWFAYPWWTDPAEAPDFATHVDIHNKPGFDPCELFFGKLPWQVSLDTRKVGGTHGYGGPGSTAAWSCTAGDFPLQPEETSLLDLAGSLKTWLGADQDETNPTASAKNG